MITNISASNYQQLLNMTETLQIECEHGSSQIVICPKLGGRVFAEVCGESMHRIDLDIVANPLDTFNNYGGNMFWPAPEGGKFGFNYEGDTWRVQEAINLQPFEVTYHDPSCVVIAKNVELVNRAGSLLKVIMTRKALLSQCWDMLRLKECISYTTVDSFEVLNEVSPEDALIAAWSLEQFRASDDTVSFCIVENARESINFDFYDHPGDRIAYFANGFSYKTDGQSVGQIGVRKQSKPSCIGFYDLSRNLICVRENLSIDDGLYFNIADNDQPEGPYSAADVYSIYNSGPDMGALELETVGSARIKNGALKGSELISRTTIGILESASDIAELIAGNN